MANINQISPDGGTTVYDIEDTPVRSSIARTEDGTSPSATINAGEEFYHLNVLYTATADIATTDTITPNSNCEVSESVTEQIASKADKSALGTASTKNSTSIITSSSDLVESGAVCRAIGIDFKNLLPPIIYVISSASATLGDNTFSISSDYVSFIMPLKHNTDYIASHTGGNRFRIILSEDFPENNGACNVVMSSSETHSYEFNSGNYNYVTFYCSYNGQSFADILPMICYANVENPTAYEPYHASVEDTLRNAEVIEGKNLLNPDNLGHNQYNSTTGAYDGTNLSFSSTTDFVKVEAGATYCISKDGAMTEARKFYYKDDGTFISSEYSASAFTIPSNATKFKFHTGGYSGSLTGWQMEKGSAVTAYEPYYVPLKDVVPNKCDNSVIGTVEDGTNPTKAYAVGEYMVRDGALGYITDPVTTSSTWGNQFAKTDIATALKIHTLTYGGASEKDFLTNFANDLPNVITLLKNQARGVIVYTGVGYYCFNAFKVSGNTYIAMVYKDAKMFTVQKAGDTITIYSYEGTTL